MTRERRIEFRGEVPATTVRLEIVLWSLTAIIVIAVIAVLPAVLSHLGLLHRFP